ncbi:MAG: ribbon-helix-helix protein, CopG family [Candidatus Dormibacteraceae bacterium]
MQKTSVYLSDQEVDGLLRMSQLTGKARAELIREGIRQLISSIERVPRRFHSMGIGHGENYQPWSVDELESRLRGNH